MVDVNKLFGGVKNVEFKEVEYCEDLDANLPVFTLKEPPQEEWNSKARLQNTKMFIQIMKRNPKNYTEVMTWINSGIELVIA